MIGRKHFAFSRRPRAGAGLRAGPRPAAKRWIIAALAVLWAVAALGAEPWSTYRGNPQRTGNTDNVAGPATSKVLWKFESREHFIASPVPHGDALSVSGLGTFNVPTFYSLAVDPKAPQRVRWSKSVPYLKLPVVSSPAASGDVLLF